MDGSEFRALKCVVREEEVGVEAEVEVEWGEGRWKSAE